MVKTINIGLNANDGTGDNLRDAMDTINKNFAQLDASNEVVEDTSPQLGGNLDTQNFIINTSTVNGNITLTPNGTGSVLLDALKINGTTISSDDSTKITLAENVDVTGILTTSTLDVNTLQSTANSQISINENLFVSGKVTASEIIVSSIGTADSSALSMNSLSVSGTITGNTVNSSGISINDNVISSANSNDNIVLRPSGTGKVQVGTLLFPSADGIANQALITDGSGNLLFQTISGGGGGITFRDDSSTAFAIAGETFTFSGSSNVTVTLDDSGDGTLNIVGPDLSSYLQNTGTQTIDNLSFNDNIISTSSNADLILQPGGTGRVILNKLASDDSTAIAIEDGLIVTSLGDTNEMLYVGASKQIFSTNVIKFDSSSNRVGIGHTSSNPNVLLDIVGETTNSAQIRLGQFNDDADGPDISLRKARGTVASPTAFQAGDVLGSVNAWSHDGGGMVATGQLRFVADDNADSSFLLGTRVGSTLATSFEVTQGVIRFNQAYSFPTADGTGNQVLVTDGSGTLAFADISSVFTPSITFVGDDSTGTAVDNGETFKITGTGGITATVSGDTLTIDGSGVSASSDIGLLKVDSTTITPAITNSDIAINTNGTGNLDLTAGGIINLDGDHVTVGSAWSTVFSSATQYNRYRYGITSLTTENFALNNVSGKTELFGNSLGALVTLTSVDDSTRTNNAWSATRVELVTDFDGRSLTSLYESDNIRYFDGGPTSLSVSNQLRNTNTTNAEISEGSVLGLATSFNVPSGNGTIDIREYSTINSNVDTNLDTGNVEIGNFYHFLITGSKKSNASATTTLDNEYGLYIKDNSIASDNYGIYIENESYKNRIGGIQFANRNITTTDSNQNLSLDANGTGSVVINGLRFPTADGTADQILKTDGAGQLSFVNVNTNPITFVGDDSTGTAVNNGETFKIAGAQGITTAVSGDVLTITGASLSGYLTNTTLYIAGDDSSTIAINNNGNLQISGGQNITTSTDSSGTVTISGSSNIIVNSISSADSSQILVEDSMRVTGTLTATSVVTSTISPPDNLTGTYTISSPTTITLDPEDEIINNAPMQLVNKTVVQLGSLVASTGAMVFVTNETDGAIPAFYDGTNWRRVTDRAVVS
jgi:hypothetical protein